MARMKRGGRRRRAAAAPAASPPAAPEQTEFYSGPGQCLHCHEVMDPKTGEPLNPPLNPGHKVSYVDREHRKTYDTFEEAQADLGIKNRLCPKYGVSHGICAKCSQEFEDRHEELAAIEDEEERKRANYDLITEYMTPRK